MDKSQILKAFNDHFEEFVNDIHLVFPNNDDIATVKTTITQLRKANPRMIMMVFKEHVIAKYKNEIIDGKINFFIDKDYSRDIESTGNSKLILEKIDCLREPVRNMSEEDQKKVIKYLQNLSKLCDLYK